MVNWDDDKNAIQQLTDKQVALLKAISTLLAGRTNAYNGHIEVKGKKKKKTYIPLHDVPLNDAVELINILDHYEIDYYHKHSENFKGPVLVVDGHDAIPFDRGSINLFIPGIGREGDYVFTHQATEIGDFHKDVAEARAKRKGDDYKLELEIPNDISGPRRDAAIMPARYALSSVSPELKKTGMLKKTTFFDWTISLDKGLERANVPINDKVTRRHIKKDSARIITDTIRRDFPEMMLIRENNDSLTFRSPDDDTSSRSLNHQFVIMLADAEKGFTQ